MAITLGVFALALLSFVSGGAFDSLYVFLSTPGMFAVKHFYGIPSDPVAHGSAVLAYDFGGNVGFYSILMIPIVWAHWRSKGAADRV